MKKTLFFLILLILSNTLHAQNNEEKINHVIIDYEKEIKDENVYNSRTLNLLFNKSLDYYITSIEIPSVKSLSAVLDNDDNSFSFGYSFDPRNGSKTDYLRFLIYTGIKLKGKKDEDFYEFFESDKASNNLGAELKMTYFIPGRIWNSKQKSPRKDIESNRITKIKRKAIEEYENISELDTTTIRNFIAENEVEYILKNKKYNSFGKMWLTLRGYFPITNNEYSFINNATDFIKSNPQFRNWDISFSLNLLGILKDNKSFTFSLIPRIYNNNNILTKDLLNQTFSTFQELGADQPVLTKTEQFYVGELEEFITSQIKSELTVFLFFNGSMGFSAAAEQNIGKYDSFNWKLGLPINLKNSKGESNINFEIQWKEITKQHYVGISIGKTFGKFVK